MRKLWMNPVRPVVGMFLVTVPLLACGDRGAEPQFTLVGEEQSLSGTVVNTELTHCAPVPDKPGTCAGRMVVEPEGAGEAGRVALEVTRDITLTEGDQPVFLQQLQGRAVSATYRDSEEGPKVATSVMAGR